MTKLKKSKLLFLGGALILMMGTTVWFTYKFITAPVVLVVGDFAGSNWDIPNWQSYRITDEAIAKFEAIHPDIKIKYLTGTPKGDYSEWLAEKIVKGNEPDVFCVLESDFNTFASIGVLKNLDSFMQDDSTFDPSKMYEKAIKSGQLSGSQYALPREVVPILMFANKTLLAREGITVPKGDWTWNDFYQICRKVTRDVDGDGKTDQFGTVGFDWQHAVYTDGQQLFDLRGEHAAFQKPGVIEAIQFIKKLSRLNSNTKPVADDFDNGRVAFRPFPFSAYRAYKYYPYRLVRYAQFEWECIKLPRGPQGNNASELYSFLIGMSSRTKHPRQAWEFLKFLTYDRKMQMNIFKYSYGVPVLREVTESKEADVELSRYTPDKEISVDKKILSQVIEQSTVAPRFQKYEEAMGMADKEIYRLINEDIDIDSALQRLDIDINKSLRQ